MMRRTLSAAACLLAACASCLALTGCQGIAETKGPQPDPTSTLMQSLRKASNPIDLTGASSEARSIEGNLGAR